VIAKLGKAFAISGAPELIAYCISEDHHLIDAVVVHQ